jgi:hypothetical protein
MDRKTNNGKKIMKKIILIVTLLFVTTIIVTYSYAGEKILHSKIVSIQPEKTDGQYCFIKVVIKQKGDEIIKEEILECADGKKGIETPGYWELYAQFYYRETTTPEYCRYYTRPEHALRSFGKMCLKINGEWEVE